PQDVVGHSDIAPQRKQDPGPLFPWRQLAQAGIGAWPDERDVQRLLAGRDRHAPVPMTPLLDKLARYGYAVDASWDARQQRNVLAAFQMHFRPDDVRGEPDAESEAIIDALLVKYGAWR
ncbi:N-acetylmuramoyl-L-alanine amidase, partial [Serratia marcescens]|nr:N-acetylmuramoyl-L-alanine amidase [Serratia marcescens]